MTEISSSQTYTDLKDSTVSHSINRRDSGAPQPVRDRHRPIYHFMPESNWLNDPNGLIQWKGKYHLFYQYNPNGPFHGTIHWGHAVSTDLVHWEHLPVALAPTPGGPDQDGCFSGCAVDDNGVATLIYTGVCGADQLACVATSTDDQLEIWEKYPANPVIAAPPDHLDLVAYRDHSVWREGDWWYQVVGAGIRDVGGAALLYRSLDLRQWEYLHPLCIGDLHAIDPVWTGQMWECPAFFSLGDQHVLIVSVWSEQRLYYTVAMLGTYVDHRFTPTAIHKLDYGDHCFYAPQTLLDDQGRRLVWGWLQEDRSADAQRAAGWSGVMSLPRELTLGADGRVVSRPVAELESLRATHMCWSDLEVVPESHGLLPDVQGKALEIKLTIDPETAESVGISLCRAPDDSEATNICYDVRRSEIVVDRTRSSLDATTLRDDQAMPCRPDKHGTITLHILLDHSVVEIFTHEGMSLTSRIYPTRPDSLGVDLHAVGGRAMVESLDIWTLRSIW